MMNEGNPADERKQLPHDIALEQELLGALLLANQVFPLVDARVQSQHFYEPLHQQIYDICAKLIRADKPATPTTIGAFLPKDVTVGGEPLRKYLAAMAANATTIINAPDFAQMVKDLADYRDIIKLTEEMGSLRGQVDPTEIATAAIEQLSVIVEDRTDVGSPALNMDQSVLLRIERFRKYDVGDLIE
jgi:replicative DNA helicase